MKSNKKASGGFAIIAFSVIAVILLLGGIGYVLTKNSSGVYKEVSTSDLKIKANDVYQYIGSTTDVDKVSNVELKVENVNEDKDYNLKIIYEALGKNETLNVEILGGKTELIKVPNLFSATDINGVDVYSKTIKVLSGDNELASFDYKLNVGKVTVDRTNAKLRVLEVVIADSSSDSIILWYDIEDNLSVSDVLPIDVNDSRITITDVDFEEDTLVENEWIKITLNYDVKGSVFEDEYLEDGFKARLEISNDETNSSNYVDIIEDLIKTSSLNDLAKLQATSFEEISSVN